MRSTTVFAAARSTPACLYEGAVRLSDKFDLGGSLGWSRSLAAGSGVRV